MNPGTPRLGVALFGVGRAGQYHLPTLARHPHVTLRWVVEVEAARDRARDLCAAHGLTDVQFAAADRCDVVTVAVVVTTPTPFHEDITKRALRAGKHVFCEKPLSFTSAAVRSCYQAAEEHGKVLFCGFNKRFDEDHVALRRAVHCGKVGDARAVYYTWRDPTTSPPFLHNYLPASGGIFCDSVIHQLDYVPWLLGQKPCSLVDMGGRTSKFADVFEKCGDVDSTVITLHFPSGLSAVIEVTREAPLDDVYFRLEVLGTKGTLLLHKLDRDTVYRVGVEGEEGKKGEEGGRKAPLSLWSSYKHEMECFIRVIQVICNDDNVTLYYTAVICNDDTVTLYYTAVICNDDNVILYYTAAICNDDNVTLYYTAVIYSGARVSAEDVLGGASHTAVPGSVQKTCWAGPVTQRCQGQCRRRVGRGQSHSGARVSAEDVLGGASHTAVPGSVQKTCWAADSQVVTPMAPGSGRVRRSVLT
ncbi:hypothetical protein ACOMHN_051029 [Nucella lapillus]